MAGKRVNGAGNRARSGAETLTLLAAPTSAEIVRALSDGPRRQAELRSISEVPAQTTLRTQLERLVETGAIDKLRRNRFPGTLEYELTAAGHELLYVADALERWLAKSPSGPAQLGGSGAKATVKALTDAWSATVLRVLAAHPLTLTELSSVVSTLSYPSLERRLSAMRLTGLTEATEGERPGTPYGVTAWQREGAGPLIAAARWERRHRSKQTAVLGNVEAETLFLLSAPLLELPKTFSGSCRMAVELPAQRRPLAGIVVEIDDGAPVAWTTDLRGEPDASAIGAPLSWLDAAVTGETGPLKLSGARKLARKAVGATHGALFWSKPSTASISIAP